ncbi:hypothetical protein LC612_00880 [Nostoc sp. CHAB 5834]|nr:hypothetical protein [Nostoc sp. CHAB 5834]
MLPSAAFASPSLVEKGDAITFRTSALRDPNNVVKIEWQQDFRNRNQDYVETAVTYTVDSQDAFAPLFVQKNLVDELLEECEDKTAKKCMVKVNNDFQYGQDRDKTSRFLVYHDRGNKPYQHRFINSELASKFASSAQQLAESAGKTAGEIFPQVKIATEAFNKILSLGKAYIGDYLRNF